MFSFIRPSFEVVKEGRILHLIPQTEVLISVKYLFKTKTDVSLT
jgi:hypothetical protein